MAETFLQVAPDGAGQKIAAQEVTRGADDVLRQEIVLSDPATDDAVVSVLNTDPATDAYALPVRPAAPLPEVSVTDTISALNDVVTLEIEGRSWVGIGIPSGALTVNMNLAVEHSYDGGATYGEKYFWNGDNLVSNDKLPHAAEDGRDYSVIVGPAVTHIRLRAYEWTSGSISVTIRANDRIDQTFMLDSLFAIQSQPTTLGALNAAVSMQMYGKSVGFFVEAGNLAGTIVVESSPDSHGSVWINSVFFAQSAWRSSLVLASPGTGFTIHVPMGQGVMRYRLRVSAYTSGSCVAHGRVGKVIDVVGSTVTGTIPNTVAPFFATQVGGVGRTNEATAVTAGNLAALTADATGRVVTTPYALHADLVSAVISKTATGSAALLAAQGAGVRTYVTGFGASNTSATPVFVALYDGATLKDILQIPAGTSVWRDYPTPMRGTANTAVNVDISATATTIYLTMTGYKSAL